MPPLKAIFCAILLELWLSVAEAEVLAIQDACTDEIKKRFLGKVTESLKNGMPLENIKGQAKISIANSDDAIKSFKFKCKESDVTDFETSEKGATLSIMHGSVTSICDESKSSLDIFTNRMTERPFTLQVNFKLYVSIQLDPPKLATFATWPSSITEGDFTEGKINKCPMFDCAPGIREEATAWLKSTITKDAISDPRGNSRQINGVSEMTLERTDIVVGAQNWDVGCSPAGKAWQISTKADNPIEIVTQFKIKQSRGCWYSPKGPKIKKGEYTMVQQLQMVYELDEATPKSVRARLQSETRSPEYPSGCTIVSNVNDADLYAKKIDLLVSSSVYLTSWYQVCLPDASHKTVASKMIDPLTKLFSGEFSLPHGQAKAAITVQITEDMLSPRCDYANRLVGIWPKNPVDIKIQGKGELTTCRCRDDDSRQNVPYEATVTLRYSETVQTDKDNRPVQKENWEATKSDIKTDGCQKSIQDEAEGSVLKAYVSYLASALRDDSEFAKSAKAAFRCPNDMTDKFLAALNGMAKSYAQSPNDVPKMKKCDGVTVTFEESFTKESIDLKCTCAEKIRFKSLQLLKPLKLSASGDFCFVCESDKKPARIGASAEGLEGKLEILPKDDGETTSGWIRIDYKTSGWPTFTKQDNANIKCGKSDRKERRKKELLQTYIEKLDMQFTSNLKKALLKEHGM